MDWTRAEGVGLSLSRERWTLEMSRERSEGKIAEEEKDSEEKDSEGTSSIPRLAMDRCWRDEYDSGEAAPALKLGLNILLLDGALSREI